MTAILATLGWSDWITSFLPWFSLCHPANGCPNQRYLPSFSYLQFSLVFQTLPIYPGLLSEKVLTFKRVILGNGTHPCFQSALQLSGLCVPPAFLSCMPCQLKCTWVESGRFLIVVLLILKAQREPHLFWASQNSLYNQFLWLFKQSQ